MDQGNGDRRMRRVIVVILDGLGRHFVDAARIPHLHRFAGRATRFTAYRSEFLSATRSR
jgi:predicted AlkP superfamily pyrophosphatase or phosphodiesterase